MLIKKLPTWVLLILLSTISFGQTKIEGRITDAADSTTLPFVSVILYQYQTNNILDYTQSDEDGNYKLEVPSQLSILTLKTSRLGYHPFTQDIVLGAEKDTTITFSFKLAPKAQQLQEVIVQGPIIVKEDTIIYDVEHFTEARDQKLEDVLSKIPGFKIRSDGAIEVNGKTIDKVLIDGEEVTDAGAALLTRSVSPDDVEHVEVRMDEKDDKLKESLLDTRDYVVLDIKLKKELNKSLFGKVRFTVGHQNTVKPGGYINGFSLKKKFKVHVFAEHDRFGTQTISLNQIKNIGEESIQKNFDRPADFNEFTERQAFNDEIFGFRDYTRANKNVVGITTRYSASPSFDVFFGSYNSHTIDEKKRSYSQEFTEFNFSNQFSETKEIRDYTSKNKLEIRFDKDRLKARFDMNAVIFQNDYSNFNAESFRNLNYDFSDTHESASFYNNLFFEYAHSEKLGFQLKAANSFIDANHSKILTHNDSTYSDFFFTENNTAAFNFNQKILSTAENFLSEGMVQYLSKLGAIQAGFRFKNRNLKSDKGAINQSQEGNMPSVPLFEGANNLSLRKYGPFLNHRMEIGYFSFNNEIGLSTIHYPNELNNHFSEHLIEYKTSVDYSPPGFDYVYASLKRQITSFPMYKLLSGYDIVDFQTVFIPQQNNFKPQLEYVAEVAGAKKVASWGILLDPAILYGRVLNGNRFLFNETTIISNEYDQLKSEYLLASMPVRITLKSLPLQMIFEPEWLGNQNQNIDPNGSSYETRTSRTLIGMKINSLFENSPFNFNIYPKYSAFKFYNELSDNRTKQEMLSLNFSSKFDFFEEKLLVTPSLRTVRFFGNVKSNFTNLSLKVESPSEKWRWFFSAHNLLNNADFVRQTIYPTYFISEQNQVFARYFKAGIEYEFK